MIALFYQIDQVDPVLQELKELKENVLRDFLCTLQHISTCYECDNCHKIFTNECQLEQHIETYPSVWGLWHFFYSYFELKLPRTKRTQTYSQKILLKPKSSLQKVCSEISCLVKYFYSPEWSEQLHGVLRIKIDRR